MDSPARASMRLRRDSLAVAPVLILVRLPGLLREDESENPQQPEKHHNCNRSHRAHGFLPPSVRLPPFAFSTRTIVLCDRCVRDRSDAFAGSLTFNPNL